MPQQREGEERGPKGEPGAMYKGYGGGGGGSESQGLKSKCVKVLRGVAWG